ncbi:MAG: TolC family protein [Burkholderiales bacterium]|jgi:adhesin transport system outer membrane protein|uniref:TolC family protein n=1 Tax=Limnobacter sp. TaxID=2003368 RepID=UPI0039BD807D|nr:TolC family protein [Burkholderiales bacterium]
MTNQLDMTQGGLWARKALCMLLASLLALPAAAQNTLASDVPSANAGNDNNEFRARRIAPSEAANMSKEELTKVRFLNMLRTNPEIVTSRINVNASQFIEDGARAAYFPRITVGANASSSSTVTNRQSTDITVTQPLYTAGRITARVKAAETDGTIADGQFVKTIQDVVLEGFLASSTLSRNALLVEASRAAEAAVAQLLALEERRVELGGSGITDAQFAKARLAVTRDRLVNFEGQFEEARATYFRYFGAYPEGYNVPELEIQRNMLPQLVDEAVTKALFSNPEIRVAESQIVKARHNYTAEDASLYPSLNLVGIQQFFGEPDPFTGDRTDSSVNLRLQYSAFSGGEQVARVNQAAATIDTRRAQLSAARLRVEESVRFQWGKWAAGQSRAQTLRGAYADSLQVFKNRKRLRDFGRETVIVMLDAQVEYFNVLIAYINAVFDARDASFRLMHAMGLMLPTPGAEADWFALFFSKNPERERLESSLKDTADIASSPADQKIAEKLGLDVSQAEVEKAAGFVLTPAQRLEIEKRSERSRLQGTTAEKQLSPTLKPAPVLDPRFYR